jgi:hypothetical protein
MSSVSFADGFVCESEDSGLNVEVYNKVNPDEGTRVGNVMVVSDSSIGEGLQTIAVFRESSGLLVNESSTYTGKVDLRFKETGRAGENIGGTKLGQLAYVVLHVDFKFSKPVLKGTLAKGELILITRNGQQLREDLACYRYLKGG